MSFLFINPSSIFLFKQCFHTVGNDDYLPKFLLFLCVLIFVILFDSSRTYLGKKHGSPPWLRECVTAQAPSPPWIWSDRGLRVLFLYVRHPNIGEKVTPANNVENVPVYSGMRLTITWSFVPISLKPHTCFSLISRSCCLLFGSLPCSASPIW